MTRRDNADIVGGLLTAGLGLFVLVHAQSYEMGTLRQIGPGFFPAALGVLLIGLGAIIAVPAAFREGHHTRIDLWPAFCIVGSLLFFAFALRPMGLILTTAATVLIASLAAPRFAWSGRLLLSLTFPIITWAVFVLGLRMTIPVWPRF